MNTRSVMFRHTKTIASANAASAASNKVASPFRTVEYLDALASLELAIWQCRLYDDVGRADRNCRQACKSIMVRITDWKVRAIVYNIMKSKNPSSYALDLVKDMEDGLTQSGLTRQLVVESKEQLQVQNQPAKINLL